MYTPINIITTITPDGTSGRVAFEGAADPTLIMETYCKGAITKWHHLTGLVAMITNHMVERRLELLHHIQEACHG